MKRFLSLSLAALFFIVIALLLAYFQFVKKPLMIQGFIRNAPQPVQTVAAEPAQNEEYTPKTLQIGSLRAVQGVDVSSQIGGSIRAIRFESGQQIDKGAILVELDDSVEQADLKAALATARNAELTHQRQLQLIKGAAAAQSSVDSALASRGQAEAAVERIRAVIAQKAIIAPFSGRIGVRRIDIGQYVSPGAPLANLQQLDPIYVDFQAAEQLAADLKPGQPFTAAIDAYPNRIFQGTIKFLDSRISVETRSFLVRGEMSNADKILRPGMFVNVSAAIGAPRRVVTAPRTAVSYSLYGDSVFIVKQDNASGDAGASEAGASKAETPEKTEAQTPVYTIERRFVKTGAVDGMRVILEQGVAAGEMLVSEGQIKLQNGEKVQIAPQANLPPLTPLPKP